MSSTRLGFIKFGNTVQSGSRVWTGTQATKGPMIYGNKGIRSADAFTLTFVPRVRLCVRSLILRVSSS